MPTRSSRVPASLVAGGGVMIGHLITYLVVAPDGASRMGLLDRTGHGYLDAANDAALLVAFAGLAALLLRVIARDGRDPNYRDIAAHLIAAQVVIFTTMELVERWSAGTSVLIVLDGWLLPIGLVVQAAVALAAAAVLGLTCRVGSSIARLIARGAATPRGRTSIPLRPLGTPPPLRWAVAASPEPRGPPTSRS